MKYFFLIIFTAIALILSGQGTDCEAIKSEPVPIAKLQEDPIMLQVYENILSLKKCGLDSIDIQIILESPFLSSLIAAKKGNDTGLTYGDIYNEYLALSEQGAFKELKRKLLFVNELENKKVSLENWGSDKEQLREFGADDNIIRALEQKLNEGDIY